MYSDTDIELTFQRNWQISKFECKNNYTAMSAFATKVAECRCADLHRVVKSDEEKYLCFTRMGKEFVVCISDGVTLWKIDLDEEELDVQRDLAGIGTIDAFLTKLR